MHNNIIVRIRHQKNIIGLVVYLVLTLILHRYFSIPGLLFIVGGVLGYYIPYLEHWIVRFIPGNSSQESHVGRSIFYAQEVVLAYIVFSFAFLITNRVFIANGMLLGFGAKIALDMLSVLNNPSELKHKFFWKLAISYDIQKKIAFVFCGIMVIFALLV